MVIIQLAGRKDVIVYQFIFCDKDKNHKKHLLYWISKIVNIIFRVKYRLFIIVVYSVLLHYYSKTPLTTCVRIIHIVYCININEIERDSDSICILHVVLPRLPHFVCVKSRQAVAIPICI